MFELMFCSLLTILPDYLYRRYGQGKRIGHEITFFSVWYELRWGIVTCLILTIGVITVVLYAHPSTKTSAALFRTVSILPEGSGRVAEVYARLGDEVSAGDPLFRLDDASQEAAVETARRRTAETQAAMVSARADLAMSEARIVEARSAYRQAVQELERNTELAARNANVVTERELDRLRNLVDGRQGGVDAAIAARESVIVQIETVLPAQLASANAAQEQAQIDLDKTLVVAGTDGVLAQFILRVGDFVTPLGRPAGVLIPQEAGRIAVQAGFDQLAGQVLKVGMTAEITCVSKPYVIIPMVVTEIQEFIASGAVRPTDNLLEISRTGQPGTILTYLEPMFEGGLNGVLPGTNCIANAYTNNYDRLHSDTELSTAHWVALHAIDTIGIVHAMILRIQALLLPVQTLVFSGSH